MAVPDQRPIRIEGLSELQRAFRVAGPVMSKGMREAMDAAGDPVRFDAEQLAFAEISGMRRGTIPWHRMRVGVTRSTVYVAPVQRGVKSRASARLRRPRLADRLMDEALQPALDRNRKRVEQEFEDAVTDMTKAWARV